MLNKNIQRFLLHSVLFSLTAALFVPFSSGFAEEGISTTISESTNESQETVLPQTPEDIMTLARNAGYTVEEAYRPAATIVIEANSGQVIWEDQADQAWYPASIAKMMTVYLLFDAINEGKLALDTPVIATADDEAISQIYELSNSPIVAGVTYPVADLLYMTTLASSNAATVMLANLVSNNDAAAFIGMMNSKAAQLGMTKTTFYNPSGAAASAFNGHYAPAGIDPEADNVSTARDLALMFYHLLKDHPDVLEYTNKFQVTVMENTEYATVLENSNQSIPGAAFGYEGEDGLKTGASPEGAYSYAATAQHGDFRLIEVVLGVGTWDDGGGESQRHVFGNALFDYGFTNFEYKKLLDAGTQTINDKEIDLKQEFYGLLQKGTQPEYILSDNQQLILSNQLNQVSTSIPSPSVKYQIVEKEEIKEKILAKTATSFLDNVKLAWKEYTIAAVAFTLSIILIIFTRISSIKPARSRRGAATKRNLAFILSVIFLLTAVAVISATFILGPWLPS
ncbi:DUF1958 domain-containing protein [Candidatus Enterococcus clewellii]|uniref:D-alanyl-D-alanine carboxypeptidase n=1 Tax=Candidatus Enterococcus clewellii TaxID=1834193 RepID=A0A242K7U4_9ENTE|nr:DUF1958 domain-containing protein [Enterococcus sp. 9E7_DIV0242]OTP17245.1 hypothetical protein A5888_001383 [Enterococcus sp. 9E7_DIV0242]